MEWILMFFNKNEHKSFEIVILKHPLFSMKLKSGYMYTCPLTSLDLVLGKQVICTFII